MHREQNPNLQILENAVEQLGALADDMVFLGGCATGLLLTDIAASPIRVTQDVDVITEVASLGDYHRLSVQLRERGFKEDQSPDAPICRWMVTNVVLDIMPTSPEILGFGNEWYGPAFDAATSVELPSGRQIRMVTAPHFLATKLVAFHGRGNGDYVMSHDIEDLVAVIDGRPEIVQEVKEADETLRRYLKERFMLLEQDALFIDALPGHLPGDEASQARVPLVLERLTAIAGNLRIQ
jgi:predicted nucleotidyltransferase